LPGAGFSAASAEQFGKNQMQVFEYDWLDHGAPTPDDLASAVKARPSLRRD
jgi:hypothetical protein